MINILLRNDPCKFKPDENRKLLNKIRLPSDISEIIKRNSAIYLFLDYIKEKNFGFLRCLFCSDYRIV